MIYLIRHGVSLRLEPVIDPTTITVGDPEIARALLFRLTPQFQPAHYLVIGRDPSDPQANTIIEDLVSEFERSFKVTPNVIRDLSKFETCEKPCWIVTDQKSANQLSPNLLIEQKIRPTQKDYFTLTILNFSRDVEVPDHCDAERRVSDDCLIPLAVRSVKRKFKEDQKYFFVTGYFEQDYFLMIER